VKYTAAFICFALGLGWAAAQSNNLASVALFWATVSCCVLAFAYGARRPGLVIGKKSNGSASWFWTTVNLPWLLFTWATWWVLANTSREPAVSQISGTNIFISRWPFLGGDLSKFEVIIDLAAELPRFYKFEGRYESLPNLDGVELVNSIPLNELNRDTAILVHCAQGHGRSASFTALLLGRLGQSGSSEAAITSILLARPLAKMASCQLQHVKFNFKLQADHAAFGGIALPLVSGPHVG
jgi:hypothetical protein